MAPAPDAIDRLSFGVVLGLFVLGAIWLTVLLWPWRRTSHRPERVNSKLNKTLRSRRGNTHALLSKRVHLLFAKAKRFADAVRMQSMEMNASLRNSGSLRRKSAANLLAVTLTFEEKLAQILNDAGEDLEVSRRAVASLDQKVQRLNACLQDIQAMLSHEIRASNDEALRELQSDLLGIATSLGSEATGRIEMELDSEELVHLERRLRRHIRFKDRAWRNSSDRDDDDDEEEEEKQSLWERWVPARLREHPYFWGLFWGMYVSILLSFFVDIGRGRIQRYTFLPIPPQYNLEEVDLQKVLVPILYGVMHTALYALVWLPVGMMRGLWRDLAITFPNIRSYIPIDDFVYFHKLCGILSIGGVVTGATIWIIAMGPSCFDSSVASQPNQERACTAFDPIIVDAKENDILFFDSIAGASYADPRDNVLFLRLIVWLTWIFLMPLINYVRDPPPSWLPETLKRNFFEIAWFLHFYIAMLSLVIALYARFEVFFPTLLTWSIWALDRWRDMIFSTYNTEILVHVGNPETSLCHTSDADNKPTILNLRITKPAQFRCTAGQIIYLKVGDVDPIWHPFSLASCSADDQIHLHIGIRGDWAKTLNKRGEWTQPSSSATWTYKLLQQFRLSVRETSRTGQASNIPCKVRGPYGSPFTKCFNPKYRGVVVIGAGTGLTSALSVLKEMMHKRFKGKSNQHVWFVWSCRHVEDLLWAWRTLEATLYQAYREGTLDPEADPDWSPFTSTMIDWLSITIFVTRSDRAALMKFLSAPPATNAPRRTSSILTSANNPEDDFGAEPDSLEASGATGASGASRTKAAPPKRGSPKARRRSSHSSSPMATPVKTNAKPKRQHSANRDLATVIEDEELTASLPGQSFSGDTAGSPVQVSQPESAESAESRFDGFSEDEGDYSLAADVGKRSGTDMHSRAFHPDDDIDRYATLPTSDPATCALRMESLYASAQMDDIYGQTYQEPNAKASQQPTPGVPAAPSWLYGPLAREDAEERLQASGKVGDFLVRHSGTAQEHVLSVLVKKGSPATCEHYLLRKDKESNTYTLNGQVLNASCTSIQQVIRLLVERGHSNLPVKLIVPEDASLVPISWSRIRRTAKALEARPHDPALQTKMMKLLQESSNQRTEHDLHSWLKQQILETSMDHRDANIENLLGWAREVLVDRFVDGATAKIAVCFCGPSSLAHMIASAAAKYGGSMQYSAEHQ